MTNEPTTQTIPAKGKHKPRGQVAKSTRTRWRVLVLVLVHAAVLAHVLHWWSTGTSISPVEPSEAFETLAYGTVNAGFLLLVFLILSTAIFGRFFCGWACHLVAYQDLCASFLARFGLRPKPVRSRLLAWVPALAAIDIFVLPAVQRFAADGGASWSLTWATTTDSLWQTFPGWAMALATLAVDGFLVVWFFGAKGFCSYGCPYGALFGVATKVAPGRIQVDENCEGCGHCTAVCTSNVEVHREVAKFGYVVDSACMRCMDCVSVCPKGALSFGFGAPSGGREKAAAPPKPQRTYDFSWTEELAMALVFAGSVYSLRSLYGAVPFLLAIGLATIAALTAIVFARLLRGRDLTFQNYALRTGGKLTKLGGIALVLAPLYLLFVAHSGFVNYHQRQGVHWNEAAAGEAPGSPAATSAIAQATHHLTLVADWSLVPTAEVHNRLGQLLSHTADRDAAMGHLERALEIDAQNASAHIALAELQLLEDRRQDAASHLLDALSLRPGEPRAANALLSLLLRDGSLRAEAIARLALLPATFDQDTALQTEARVRLAEAQTTALDFGAALTNLDQALTQSPAHPTALRTLQIILQRAPDNAQAKALAHRIQGK